MRSSLKFLYIGIKVQIPRIRQQADCCGVWYKLVQELEPF